MLSSDPFSSFQCHCHCLAPILAPSLSHTQPLTSSRFLQTGLSLQWLLVSDISFRNVSLRTRAPPPQTFVESQFIPTPSDFSRLKFKMVCDPVLSILPWFSTLAPTFYLIPSLECFCPLTTAHAAAAPTGTLLSYVCLGVLSHRNTRYANIQSFTGAASSSWQPPPCKKLSFFLITKNRMPRILVIGYLL